jgi:hypothetical protein
MLEDLNASPPTGADQYWIGLDLGAARDPSAVAVVRKQGDPPTFQCGWLERIPLNTPYPAVIDYCIRMAQSLRGAVEVCVDYTGVGRPCYELFQLAGFSSVVGICITAGDTVSRDGSIFRVSKGHLISRVQSLMHSGRLRVHKDLAHAPALLEELRDFRAEVSDVGHWRYSARAGRSDDLLLALACAIFRAHGEMMGSWGIYEFYRQQYGNGHTDREVTSLPPPLEPLPPAEGPKQPFSFGNQTIPRSDLVVLRAPATISSASGLSGRVYVPDPRTGNFTMTAQDAKVFLMPAHGWLRVTPPSP